MLLSHILPFCSLTHRLWLRGAILNNHPQREDYALVSSQEWPNKSNRVGQSDMSRVWTQPVRADLTARSWDISALRSKLEHTRAPKPKKEAVLSLFSTAFAFQSGTQGRRRA